MITKQGRKFEMDPLLETIEEKHVGYSVMLLSGKEFLKAMKKDKGVCCAMVVRPKDKTKEKASIPLEV